MLNYSLVLVSGNTKISIYKIYKPKGLKMIVNEVLLLPISFRFPLNFSFLLTFKVIMVEH